MKVARSPPFWSNKTAKKSPKKSSKLKKNRPFFKKFHLVLFLKNPFSRQFELALRTYEGDDPLEPWFRYILWVEQTFSTAAASSKEGNLNTLLEKSIKEFKGHEQYEQDPRFLEIWMKYANLSSHPLEVYQYMHAEGVCDQLAKFYTEWAWQLEQVNNLKKAEATFKMALERVLLREEIDLVEMKHKQFQARVMKKMLEQSSESGDGLLDNAQEEQRTALSSLRGHGKVGKVGTLRIGPAKIQEGPGILPAAGQISNGNNGQKFQIYQANDENCDPIKASMASNLPFAKGRNRENETDPGKWTQNRIGKKAQAIPLDAIGPKKPAFQVHQDENIVTPGKNFCYSDNKVLASHKPKKAAEDDVPIALALFEPPDPNKIVHYCKHLVYQGTTEFSFEELRAARFRQKEGKEEVALKMRQMETLQREMIEEKERLKAEMEAFQRQKLEFERMQLERQQNFEKMIEEKLKREMDSIRAKQDKKESCNFVKPKSSFKIYSDSNSNSEMSREPTSSSLLEDTKTLLQKDPLGGESKENSLQHKTPPRLAPPRTCSMEDKLSQPSPTINTKEAMNLMQEMWGQSKLEI